jgi:hypothetical protein
MDIIIIIIIMNEKQHIIIDTPELPMYAMGIPPIEPPGRPPSGPSGALPELNNFSKRRPPAKLVPVNNNV